MKKVKCVRCHEIMEYDGDAWHCDNCGMIAVEMDGEPFFMDDELDYGNIFTIHCPDCSTVMVGVGDGYECPQCGRFIGEGEYIDELED